jgi:hypothetical protein
MIVKALARRLVQHLTERVVPVLGSPAPAQDRGLGRGQDAVEPAQHDHGWHETLVPRRTVGAAQEIGNLPDKIGVVVMVGP